MRSLSNDREPVITRIDSPPIPSSSVMGTCVRKEVAQHHCALAMEPSRQRSKRLD
jgi:hypothetical protein